MHMRTSSLSSIVVLWGACALLAPTGALADDGKGDKGKGRGHRDARRVESRGDRDDRDRFRRHDLQAWEVHGSIGTRRGRIEVHAGNDPYRGSRGSGDYDDYDDYDDDYYDDDYYDDRDGRDLHYYGDRHYRPVPAPFRVPRGHLPPPGMCKVWFPDLPPGHQPPPMDCATAEYEAARLGAFVVYNPG